MYTLILFGYRFEYNVHCARQFFPFSIATVVKLDATATLFTSSGNTNWELLMLDIVTEVSFRTPAMTTTMCCKRWCEYAIANQLGWWKHTLWKVLTCCFEIIYETAKSTTGLLLHWSMETCTYLVEPLKIPCWRMLDNTEKSWSLVPTSQNSQNLTE